MWTYGSVTSSPFAARTGVLVSVLLGMVAALTPTSANARIVRAASFDLAEGTAAGLRLARSSEAAALRRFGRPREREPDRNTGNTWLRWRCGTGCHFDIATRGGKVVTVWVYGNVTRARFRTRAGTHLGISATRAARLEGGSFRTSCDTALTKSRRGLVLSIGANGTGGRVDSLLMHSAQGGVPC